jgi:hypothetical protein
MKEPILCHRPRTDLAAASDVLPREFVPFPFRAPLLSASSDTALHELQTHVRSRATYTAIAAAIRGTDVGIALVSPGRPAMKIPRRRFLRLVSTIAALSAGTDNGIAQNFPARPITMIGPAPAGGATDVSARIISEHMSRTLGQQIARNACLQTPAPPAGTTGLLGRFGAAEIATSRETFCSCSGRLAILHRPGAGAVRVRRVRCVGGMEHTRHGRVVIYPCWEGTDSPGDFEMNTEWLMAATAVALVAGTSTSLAQQERPRSAPAEKVAPKSPGALTNIPGTGSEHQQRRAEEWRGYARSQEKDLRTWRGGPHG